MKKWLYYAVSFAWVLAVTLALVYLNHMGLIKLSPVALLLAPAFSGIVIGNLSPAEDSFDRTILWVAPVAFFVAIAIGAYLGPSGHCAGIPSYCLYEAILSVVQPYSLLCGGITALLTYLASYKPIRIISLVKKH